METANVASARFDSRFGAAAPVVDRGLDLRSRNNMAQESAKAADSVNVSQEALLITEALRGAQNAPDLRAEKIEALRAKIASGEYQIDNKVLAANILREEAPLFMV